MPGFDRLNVCNYPYRQLSPLAPQATTVRLLHQWDRTCLFQRIWVTPQMRASLWWWTHSSNFSNHHSVVSSGVQIITLDASHQGWLHTLHAQCSAGVMGVLIQSPFVSNTMKVRNPSLHFGRSFIQFTKGFLFKTSGK